MAGLQGYELPRTIDGKIKNGVLKRARLGSFGELVN
jgi:hypothetical protein